MKDLEGSLLFSTLDRIGLQFPAQLLDHFLKAFARHLVVGNSSCLSSYSSESSGVSHTMHLFIGSSLSIRASKKIGHSKKRKARVGFTVRAYGPACHRLQRDAKATITF